MLREEILKQIALALKYKLEGLLRAKKYRPSQLSLIYNGVGGQLMSLLVRGVLTDILPDFQTPAFIHDVLWHLTDKNPQTFKESNARFKRNALKIIEAKYGKWDPRRHIGKAQALVIHKLLDNFALKHYTSRCTCDFCKGKLA